MVDAEQVARTFEPGAPASLPDKPSDTFLVSALTASAYVTAFAYQAGAVAAWNVSLDAIDLQLLPTLAVVFMFAMVVGAILTAPYLIGRAFIGPKEDEIRKLVNAHPLVPALKSPLLFTLYVYAVRAVAPDSFRSYLNYWVMPMMVIWVAFRLLRPLWWFPEVPGFDKKHRCANQWRQSHLGTAPLYGVTPTNGWLTRLLVGTLLASVFSSALGYGLVTKETDYWVSNQQSPTVILRVFGNRALTAGFDRENKRLNGVYQWLTLDAPGLVFRQESVGPLSAFSR